MTNASAKVTLDHEITINGEKIPAGSHSLPKEVAEDATRINREYNQSLINRNVKHSYNHDAGTIAVGSGAE